MLTVAALTITEGVPVGEEPVGVALGQLPLEATDSKLAQVNRVLLA